MHAYIYIYTYIQTVHTYLPNYRINDVSKITDTFHSPYIHTYIHTYIHEYFISMAEELVSYLL